MCFSIFLFHSHNKNKKPVATPISIIICAKNEAKNLQEFLPYIINQEYPNFEIILINDASSDETLEVMESFKKKNNCIKIVNVKSTEVFLGSKKYALTLGIKAALNEHLLFIDADCKPVSKNWISEMSSQFNIKKKIIIGYGKYINKKYSLVNLLVRYETLITAVQYFSYSLFGSPYMAVGRNLAYTKSVFFSVKGFVSHIHIYSGDDDLFIQEAANKENTSICVSKNSHTTSRAPNTFKAWFRQKRRHISTASYYKKTHQFFLGFFYFTKALFYVSLLLSVFFFSWKTFYPLVLCYFIFQYIIIGLSAKKLKEKHLIYFLPFLDFFLMLFQFIIFITNLVSKPTHWK